MHPCRFIRFRHLTVLLTVAIVPTESIGFQNGEFNCWEFVSLTSGDEPRISTTYLHVHDNGNKSKMMEIAQLETIIVCGDEECGARKWNEEV